MRIAPSLMLLVAACGAVGIAMADERHGPREGRHSQMREEMRSMQQGSGMPGYFAPQGARPTGDGREMPPRMDPEERRRLRRDIDEAGRDLYRRRHP